MSKILVVGSLNMDLVTQVMKTPKVGETVLGYGYKEIPGGKGANQSIALAKFGAEVRMCGVVGNDKFGTALINNLKSNQVDIKYIKKTDQEATGLAMIMVNEDGDNSIIVISGANFELKKEDIKEIVFKEVKYILAQLEISIEVVEKAFSLAKELGVKTVLNPAPAATLSDELLRNTDLIVPNETEFKQLTNYDTKTKESISQGSKILFSKGIKEIIITLGKRGAYYSNKNGNSFYIKGYEVNAVDTTAAGDSFIGGLLSRLMKDEPMEEALIFAMKAGAITVSREGAQSSIPSINEVESFKGIKTKE